MFHRSLSALVATALLAAGVAAMVAGATKARPTVPAPVKIGLGAPISGSDAAFGAEMRVGVEQAIQDINARGGILRHRLIVDIGDDAGDPKQGIAVAKKFVADHVSFVVGHFNSGVTLAASAIYADNGILDITPASTNPQITERGLDLMFRTCGRDDQQAAVAAKFLTSLGAKKIAVIYDKTSYGKDLADQFRKALAARGGKEVLYAGVNKGEKDYSALVAKIKAADTDILYWGGSAPDAALIVKDMRAAGLTTTLMGSAAMASDEFATIGGDAVTGSYMTFPLDPRTRPAAAKVVGEFTARNIDPEAYTLYAYAAVEIIKQAAEKAKSLAPKDIAGIMHSGARFSTVLGDISYDAKGDIKEPDYSIFVWKKGPEGKLDYYPLKPAAPPT